MTEADAPKVDVKALAALARVDVSDAELKKLEKVIPEILAFVDVVQKAAGSAPSTRPLIRNVMREDGAPHEKGKYTELLLAQAHTRKDDYFVVKQIIRNKKEK